MASWACCACAGRELGLGLGSGFGFPWFGLGFGFGFGFGLSAFEGRAREQVVVHAIVDEEHALAEAAPLRRWERSWARRYQVGVRLGVRGGVVRALRGQSFGSGMRGRC